MLDVQRTAAFHAARQASIKVSDYTNTLLKVVQTSDDPEERHSLLAHATEIGYLEILLDRWIFDHEDWKSLEDDAAAM